MFQDEIIFVTTKTVRFSPCLNFPSNRGTSWWCCAKESWKKIIFWVRKVRFSTSEIYWNSTDYYFFPTYCAHFFDLLVQWSVPPHAEHAFLFQPFLRPALLALPVNVPFFRFFLLFSAGSCSASPCSNAQCGQNTFSPNHSFNLDTSIIRHPSGHGVGCATLCSAWSLCILYNEHWTPHRVRVCSQSRWMSWALHLCMLVGGSMKVIPCASAKLLNAITDAWSWSRMVCW